MIFKLNNIRQIVLLALSLNVSTAYATEFNIDVLDTEDIKNIDMSQFSIAGYVPPGDYVLTVFVNGQRLGAPRDISVLSQTNDTQTQLQLTCIPVDLLDSLGLTDAAKEKVRIEHNGSCLDFSSISGIQSKIELSTLSLKLTIPQMWLEYTDSYWTPPSLWEEGINGAFIDYNATASLTKQNSNSTRTYLSTNGIAGFNLGAWRVRGDYSATYQKQTGGSTQQENRNFDFSRLYAFTSLKSIASILTIGENYFYSNIFDAWQYTGVSLESDDRMIPPKLVGYAPEIIGVANTNATVTVRSKDRVILETAVPAGPFRIQSLESGVRGVLDVTVREENGEENKFSINTSTLPYLTRPGRVLYKLVAGKTRYTAHNLTGKPVVGGEISYGLTNAWSLYGGTQLSGNYQTIATGIGRDLFAFGALSLDITQSIAHLSNKKLQGRSYRLSYSKSFDAIRTDVTFAGYRFADRNYRTLSQFMGEERTGSIPHSAKENYQVYLNKYFDDFNISFNYQYSTYWDDKPQTQYGLYASTNVSIPSLSQQDATVSLSATRTERENKYKDDSINLYLTIPLKNRNSISYSELYSRSAGRTQYNHNVSYSGYSDDNNYNLSVGYNHGNNMDSQSSLSGYYSHNFSLADISTSASYVPQQYHSVSATINSGITATSHGVAFHRGAAGDTRLVVETPGVSDVPLNNGVVKTNGIGLAVIPSISSYRKSSVSINTSKLPKNVDSLDPMSEITLTKGAIGYRKLTVLKGEKMFAVLSLQNGKTPPFGASVRNADNRELGIVGDDGVTWLVGISPIETLYVQWAGEKQCELHLPETLDSTTDMLLLPCTPLNSARTDNTNKVS